MLLLFLVAITLTPYLSAQDLVGSTTLDIDPSTNIVTATCETDMYDGDYEASVQCWVVDGAENIVASQGYVDHGGQGYAQVVLTFQGQLGTNYIATASHVAIFNIVDLPSGPGQPTYYEDYYNYSYFEQGGAQTYPDYFDWYGPGPVVQVRKNNAHTGNTTKSAAIAPSLTMKFTDSKSPGDNLLFSAGGVPSETLGRKDFPNYWSW